MVLLTLCLLLGGASQKHEFRLMLVELAALPLIGLGALRVCERYPWIRHRFALSILLAVVAIPLIQLIPLPPAAWSALPGREDGALALEIAGLSPAWAPISVAPDMTWRSFLALLPAAALFVGVLLAGGGHHRYVNLIFIGLALSFVLGLAQALVGGPVYPWSTTTRGTVAGLFANRNHLASLCIVALPLAAAVIGTAVRRGPRSTAALCIGLAVVVVSVVTLGATQSRGGIGLLGPSLAFSALIVWAATRRARLGLATLSLTGAAGAALTLVAVLGLGPILDRFEASASHDARFERWPTVAEAAQDYLPTGAGFGSFESVYKTVETLEELDPTYFNRAHNEYLETWLEGGWLSLGVFVAFLIWFGRRAWEAWRAPAGISADMTRASSVGILMILLHSAVEYPLRTVTLMAVFAVLAAILELGPADRPGKSRQSVERAV